MFPRFLRLRCHTLFLLLLLQIMLVVWYFSRRQLSYSPSVLTRLGLDGTDLRDGDGILHVTDDAAAIASLYRWYGKDDVCVREGSDEARSGKGMCVCAAGWGGKRCGLPQSVLGVKWMTDPVLVSSLQVRKRPRRIIVVVSGFLYHFSLFELNVRLLAGLVDVFIVGEMAAAYKQSNETLLASFSRGFLKDYHDKFVYVNISVIGDTPSPVEMMHYTTDAGLRLLSDLRMDDMLLLTSADQVLRREFVLFLKLFHNYPQPIKCDNSEYLYGFYWKIVTEDGGANATAGDVLSTDAHISEVSGYHLSRKGRSLSSNNNVQNGGDTKKKMLNKYQVSSNGRPKDAQNRAHIKLNTYPIDRKHKSIDSNTIASYNNNNNNNNNNKNNNTYVSKYNKYQMSTKGTILDSDNAQNVDKYKPKINKYQITSKDKNLDSNKKAQNTARYINKLNKYQKSRTSRSLGNNKETLNKDKVKVNFGQPEIEKPSKFSNILLAEKFGDKSAIEKDLSELPSICALSVHLFANVFENKVNRLHQHQELLYKSRHVAFFEALELPIFPWTFARSGWRCRFCTDSDDAIYRKLAVLPEDRRPRWFTGDPGRYRDMLQFVGRLRERGQDEHLVQARANSVGSDDIFLDLPQYAVTNRDRFMHLLAVK